VASPVLLKEFEWSLDIWNFRGELNSLTPFRSGIVFAGEYDGEKSRDLWQGEELWQSDGTEKGTQIAADIHKGVPQLNTINGPSRPRNFIPLGRSVFFVAEEPFGGRELWSFNGKSAKQVKDISPGIFGTELSLWGTLEKKLFFQGNGVIWTSNGSQAGTKPLIFEKGQLKLDLLEGNDIASFRGYYYFPYRGMLWRTDGTKAGTSRVPKNYTDAPSPRLLTPGPKELFFVSPNSVGRASLWKTDGTRNGLTLVKTINQISPSNPAPESLTICGDYLFFSADDGKHGRELWMSDGTAKGTKLAGNIAPEILPGVSQSSNPSQLTAVGDDLYFVANDGPRGPELWKTDTRRLKTAIVKDITTTTSLFGNGSDIRNLTPVGDKLFFTINRIGGSSLWVTDGSSGGTLQIKEPSGRLISQMTLSGNKLFWAEGAQLWALDVTDELTGMGSRPSTSLDRTARLRSAAPLAPSQADSDRRDLLSASSFAPTPSSPLGGATSSLLGVEHHGSGADLITALDSLHSTNMVPAGL